MEDGRLLNYQLTASYSIVYFHAKNARLNSVVGAGGWSPGNLNSGHWIQVAFGARRIVTGIVTQGRATHPQWVTKYKVQYYDQGWFIVKDPGQSEDRVSYR